MAQKIIVGLFICLVLGACSGNKKLYLDSREAKPLEVPPGLDMPNQESALFIPGQAAPELAGRAEARPPLVLSSEEAELANTNIRYGDGALFLLVEDEPDSVWRRLGFTLNRAGMSLAERRVEEKVYRFSYTQPVSLYSGRSFWDTVFFWRNSDPVDYSGTYQIQLKPDSNNALHTRVYLYDGEQRPADPEVSDHLLGVVQQRLG